MISATSLPSIAFSVAVQVRYRATCRLDMGPTGPANTHSALSSCG
jgi:hypothetical protein